MAHALEHPSNPLCTCGAPLPSAVLPDLIRLVRFWDQRTRQRKALLELDDRLLDDISVTREQVRREASKSFWG